MQCNHPLLNNLKRKEQILSLSKRIIAFQEFLTDSETIKHRHERLKMLEGKIKEKTYQVEDIVDSKLRKYFVAKNANYRRKAFEVLCRRLQVAIEEMEFIKKEVTKIKGDKISTLKFHKQVLPARHISTSSPDVQQKPVGFQEDLEKIIDRLRGGPSELDIICIVGMAGIGKTTLAKRAYNDISVVNRFDVRAWFPSEIMQLVNLRYLALATSSEFPPTVSQFWSLQTLILHVYSRNSTLPREIWKMPNLRHLHIKPSICLPSQTNEERNGYNSLVLNNLQTLTNITLADCTTDVFSSTPKLKKLGICETVEYTYPVQIPWSDFLYTSENLWPYCSDTISDLWSDCLRNLALLPQLEALKIVGLRAPVQVPKLAFHLDEQSGNKLKRDSVL
uniref:NB-ARC domain-containing protein n=1 Tax=Solanum lycopersicum TaxID=4081 RepID=K4DBD5_SOLLC